MALLVNGPNAYKSLCFVNKLYICLNWYILCIPRKIMEYATSAKPKKIHFHHSKLSWIWPFSYSFICFINFSVQRPFKNVYIKSWSWNYAVFCLTEMLFIFIFAIEIKLWWKRQCVVSVRGNCRVIIWMKERKKNSHTYESLRELTNVIIL